MFEILTGLYRYILPVRHAEWRYRPFAAMDRRLLRDIGIDCSQARMAAAVGFERRPCGD